MHTSVKDVVGTSDDASKYNVPVGTHIVTALMEGDGAVELASKDAKLSARVISISRTDSGGVQVQTAVLISEPAPVAVKVITPEEDAAQFLVDKLGISMEAAKSQVTHFGASRVLAAKAKEAAEKNSDLDKELEAVLQPLQPDDPKA